MTEQVSMRRICRLQRGRMVIFLLSVMLGLLQVQLMAQQDSGTPSVSDLQSYEGLSVKKGSETEHWYEIRYDDQWIGWAQMSSRVLQNYQGGGGSASNILEYRVSTQIAPQLVKEELSKTFREQVREDQEEGQAITKSELEQLVKDKVKARMESLNRIIERQSKATTIYQNQNGTLREAKYGFSADQSESFTLYLEPKQLGSGTYTILIPGEVPGETDMSPERPVVNQYLAADMIAKDSFQQDQYTFALLDGTPKSPLVKVDVRPVSNENETLTIGEKKYEVRPVQVVFAEGADRTEKWWIDTDGVVRKVKRMSTGQQEQTKNGEGEEGKESQKKGPSVTFTYSSREEARRGYEFVFARNGRRNPFQPVWPKIQKGEKDGSKKGDSQCADYVAENVLERARTISTDELESVKKISNKQQRINAQRSLIKEFSTLKEQVTLCGSQEDQEQIKQFEEALQSDIDISEMVISIVEGLLESTRKAFEDRSFDQMASLKEDAMKWEGQLPSNASENQQNKFNEILQGIKTYNQRAQIRMQFRENAPEVLGVISSKDERYRALRIGIKVFGQQMAAELDVNIPDVNSMAIVRSQEGDESDKAKRPGESIDLKELAGVTVEEVHENGVVFKYKGESIKVPLLKLKDSMGKK